MAARRRAVSGEIGSWLAQRFPTVFTGRVYRLDSRFESRNSAGRNPCESVPIVASKTFHHSHVFSRGKGRDLPISFPRPGEQFSPSPWHEFLRDKGRIWHCLREASRCSLQANTVFPKETSKTGNLLDTGIP